jgi:deazaflavin-dependent oxidoreductase (nitroreductase family)
MPKPPKPDSVRWKIFYRLTDVHKFLFRLTKGRIGGSVPMMGGKILILHHVGAKSGTARSLPLQYIVGDGDEIAVIASKGGNEKSPAWYHNLKANPDTEVELPGGERRRVHVRQVEGDERSLWWDRAIAVYPDYDTYQSYTDRKIPVLVLDKR